MRVYVNPHSHRYHKDKECPYAKQPLTEVALVSVKNNFKKCYCSA